MEFDAHVVDADGLVRVSTVTIRILHATDHDWGRDGGESRRSGRSSDANVSVVANLTLGAISVGHAANSGRRSDGNISRGRGGRSCDTDVVLADLAGRAVRVDFATVSDGRGRGSGSRGRTAGGRGGS